MKSAKHFEMGNPQPSSKCTHKVHKSAVHRLDGGGKGKPFLRYSRANIEICWINCVYRRHTNFSIESIEQTFNGTADFGKLLP